MKWPEPLICQQPGELAWQHEQPQRRACVRRLEQRLRRRYASIRILQHLGWPKPPIPLLTPLQAVACLAPLDPTTQEAARAVLRQFSRSELDELSRALEPAAYGMERVLPMIVGCRSRLKTAQSAQKSFNELNDQRLHRALIVIGNPRLPDWALRFCAREGLLEIGVDDSYEALPQKVGTALAVLSLLKAAPMVLKVDDDARPGELTRLSQLASRMQNNEPQAAGFAIVTPTPLHLDRGWHMGKSNRANLKPFSSLGARTWLSGGAGYLLNPAAVSLIGQFWMHTNGFIRSMLYEDVCISMLLQAAEAHIHWLRDPADLGLFSERQQEFQGGQWSIPAEFFGIAP